MFRIKSFGLLTLLLGFAVLGAALSSDDDALLKAMDNPDEAERCISLQARSITLGSWMTAISIFSCMETRFT